MQNSIGIKPAISYFFDKSEFTSSRFLFLAADFCSVLIGSGWLCGLTAYEEKGMDAEKIKASANNFEYFLNF